MQDSNTTEHQGVVHPFSPAFDAILAYLQVSLYRKALVLVQGSRVFRQTAPHFLCRESPFALGERTGERLLRDLALVHLNKKCECYRKKVCTVVEHKRLTSDWAILFSKMNGKCHREKGCIAKEHV